jgi:2-polyprenyl-3-methyl-5-hydroxy-6-metoxy-1,4-benzoquinol methylase
MNIKETKMDSYFSHKQSQLLGLIPKKSIKRVLSLGCGYGYTEYELIKRNIEVWAIEKDEIAAIEAAKRISKVIVGDVNEVSDMCPDDYFDCLMLPDILEHLVDPLGTLRHYLNKLHNGCIVVASLPNVRFFGVVIPLVLLGRWEYKEEGVLDNTHLRFFTKKSINELFVNAGCYDITICPRYRVPERNCLKPIAKIIQTIVFKIPFINNFFAKQYLISARWTNIDSSLL